MQDVINKAEKIPCQQSSIESLRQEQLKTIIKDKTDKVDIQKPYDRYWYRLKKNIYSMVALLLFVPIHLCKYLPKNNFLILDFENFIVCMKIFKMPFVRFIAFFFIK